MWYGMTTISVFLILKLMIYYIFRGVWHDAKSYPKSWQLDPTEGPGRVRKRLKRCHLGIENRFLTPDNQYKLGRAFNINFHFFIFMNF